MEVFRGSRAGRLVAYVVAGHHAGLSDWIGTESRTALADRLRETEHLIRALRGGPQSEILNPQIPASGIPAGADPGLWVRMLASALFDADFLDTEAFFDPSKGANRKTQHTIEDLERRLERHLLSFARSPSTPVNTIRAEVLAACRASATNAPGVFSLTVPTGGGKTLSSLAFALAHARRHGLERVIYAVPFTSIIEQTAAVFRRAFAGAEDAVLEHHSSLDPACETARSRLAAENWDAPLIVTTTVQLFESLFASRTSRVRKLHNLARSVIVLDEAQALPPAVLRPVVAALRELYRHYGATVVLCTATQPAHSALFDDFRPTEIVSDPAALFARLARVQVELPPPGARRSWEDLAAEVGSAEQSLAIVNTRRDALALHSLLPPETIHLSTYQCAAHRSRLLADIRKRLKNGEPARVVSTSLVEAGVDIDFPVVFRAMTGLDQLAQAAGRCNREGRLASGRFVVFRPEGGRTMKSVAQAIEAAEAALAGSTDQPFCPATFESYFRALYWAKGDAALDAFDMAGLLGLGRKGHRFEGDPFAFQYRTAAERFRMIEDSQETVVVPYNDDVRRALSDLRFAGPSRSVMRRLQRYTVPVPPPVFARLLGEGTVVEIEGVPVLQAVELYREDVGLARWCLSEFSIQDLIG